MTSQNFNINLVCKKQQCVHVRAADVAHLLDKVIQQFSCNLTAFRCKSEQWQRWQRPRIWLAQDAKTPSEWGRENERGQNRGEEHQKSGRLLLLSSPRLKLTGGAVFTAKALPSAARGAGQSTRCTGERKVCEHGYVCAHTWAWPLSAAGLE